MMEKNDPYSRVRKLRYKNIIKRRANANDPSVLKDKETRSHIGDTDDKGWVQTNKDDPFLHEKPKNEFEKDKITRKQGKGRIISSGITVQGFHTKFQHDLNVGDMIEIEHPNTLITETRQVVSIASDRTLIIDKEFSSDLVSTSEYCIVSGASVDEYKEKSNTISYREKQGLFKYKTIIKSVDSNLSREDILDIRAKKQRDKYCWI